VPGSWELDRSWAPSSTEPFWSADLDAAVRAASVAYAYIRRPSPGEGSITAFIPRSRRAGPSANPPDELFEDVDVHILELLEADTAPADVCLRQPVYIPVHEGAALVRRHQVKGDRCLVAGESDVTPVAFAPRCGTVSIRAVPEHPVLDVGVEIRGRPPDHVMQLAHLGLTRLEQRPKELFGRLGAHPRTSPPHGPVRVAVPRHARQAGVEQRVPG
jgi:hypothetical protein